MVQVPFALKAPGSLGHTPRGNEQSKNLPPGAMKIFDVWKAGKAQAGGKCAQRKQNGANEGFLARPEDREEAMHNPSMYLAERRERLAYSHGGSDRAFRATNDKLGEPVPGSPKSHYFELGINWRFFYVCRLSCRTLESAHCF